MARSEERKVNKNAWMVTFSDLVTLMITFFVLLLTMSNIDQNRLKKMFRFFPGAGSTFEGGDAKEPKKKLLEDFHIASRLGRENWLDEQHRESFHAVKRWLEDRDLDKEAKVVVREDKFEIQLDNQVFFQLGSTKVNAKIKPFLAEVAGLFSAKKDMRLRIEVVATDPRDLEAVKPVRIRKGEKKEKPYKSLWQLAIARGDRLVSILQKKHKIDKRRLSLMGYGIKRPTVVGGMEVDTFGQRIDFIFLENDEIN